MNSNYAAASPKRWGGPDKVARQHEFGKLTIRERLQAIADPDSFREIGKLAGSAEIRQGRQFDRR